MNVIFGFSASKYLNSNSTWGLDGWMDGIGKGVSARRLEVSF